MRAVFLEAPEALLDERRRLGLDRCDEMWEGVLHVVPSPTPQHQRIEARLHFALDHVARPRGIEALTNTEVHRASRDVDDYRTPDIVVHRPEDEYERGVAGHAVLVVEILSPRDETRAKLPFYARAGVRHVLIVDPQNLATELLVRVEAGYEAVTPDAEGALRVPELGLSLTAVVGRSLTIEADGVETVVPAARAEPT